MSNRSLQIRRNHSIRAALILGLCCASLITEAQTVATGDIIGFSSGTYNCEALRPSDTVVIALSADNGGAFACNGKDVGIAVANAKGKGVVYSISTAGGKTIISTQLGRFGSIPIAAAAADIQAAARLAEAGT